MFNQFPLQIQLGQLGKKVGMKKVHKLNIWRKKRVSLLILKVSFDFYHIF